MRITGVTPQFQPPTRQVPSRRMWWTIGLCVALPPVGLVMLWTSARNPLRGKVIISIIAVLSMTLMITIFLMSKAQNASRISADTVSEYQLGTQSEVPAQVQELGGEQPVIDVAPVEVIGGGQTVPGSDEIMPANPVG